VVHFVTAIYNKGRGEIPGSDLGGAKGLRHLRLLWLGEGHPRSTGAWSVRW